MAAGSDSSIVMFLPKQPFLRSDPSSISIFAGRKKVLAMFSNHSTRTLNMFALRPEIQGATEADMVQEFSYFAPVGFRLHTLQWLTDLATCGSYFTSFGVNIEKYLFFGKFFNIHHSKVRGCTMLSLSLSHSASLNQTVLDIFLLASMRPIL